MVVTRIHFGLDLRRAGRSLESSVNRCISVKTGVLRAEWLLG